MNRAATPERLTDQQEKVLDFIRSHIAREGYPPTLHEIKANFGWKSQNSAATHVNALHRLGKIEVAPGLSRGIRLAAPQQPKEQGMDKSDRELLELAAKAAKFPREWNGDIRIITDTGERRWNPLTDDGDTLRLAVQLDIDILFSRNYVLACNDGMVAIEHGERQSATRRAVTRVAAEIGAKQP